MTDTGSPAAPDKEGRRSAASTSLREGVMVFPGSRLSERGLGTLGAGRSVALCLLMLFHLDGAVGG